jgi:hypothetical protein
MFPLESEVVLNTLNTVLSANALHVKVVNILLLLLPFDLCDLIFSFIYLFINVLICLWVHPYLTPLILRTNASEKRRKRFTEYIFYHTALLSTGKLSFDYSHYELCRWYQLQSVNRV